jgi:segregation and condensation protein B
MDKPVKPIVEALLFASGKPLTLKEIHDCVPETEMGDIRQALAELVGEYEAMGRSFALREVAGGYQFRTANDYAPYVLKLFRSSPARLSKAALETLAIIAYKQPILRQEIERLRGVEAGGILKTLMEKELVKVVGRKNLPGKPLIYGTTRRFLEVFDLRDLDSLPKLREIKALGPSDEPEAPQPRDTEPQGEGGTWHEGKEIQETVQEDQEEGRDEDRGPLDDEDDREQATPSSAPPEDDGSGPED